MLHLQLSCNVAFMSYEFHTVCHYSSLLGAQKGMALIYMNLSRIE